MTILADLYTELYGSIEAKGKMKNLAELAVTLSRIAKVDPPWTARHLNNIVMGYKPMPGEVERAVLVVGARLDGAHPLTGRLREITVFTVNGLEPGMVIYGKMGRCAYCQMPILKNPHNRKYCCVECRVAKYKEK